MNDNYGKQEASCERHAEFGSGNAERGLCRTCCRQIDAGNKFCPHCGSRQSSGGAWYYHPLWILVLAFFVIGPFALILVARSSRMSMATKVAFSVAIIAYTAYLCVISYKLAILEMELVKDLSGAIR